MLHRCVQTPCQLRLKGLHLDGASALADETCSTISYILNPILVAQEEFASSCWEPLAAHAAHQVSQSSMLLFAALLQQMATHAFFISTSSALLHYEQAALHKHHTAVSASAACLQLCCCI
jgi:hypothetical protein